MANIRHFLSSRRYDKYLVWCPGFLFSDDWSRLFDEYCRFLDCVLVMAWGYSQVRMCHSGNLVHILLFSMTIINMTIMFLCLFYCFQGIMFDSVGMLCFGLYYWRASGILNEGWNNWDGVYRGVSGWFGETYKRLHVYLSDIITGYKFSYKQNL